MAVGGNNFRVRSLTRSMIDSPHFQRAHDFFLAAVARLRSPLLLALRLFFGWQFFLTGKGKLGDLEKPTAFFRDLGIPLPHFNAILAGSTECIGGLLLLVGLATRVVSVPLTVLLCVAYATADREALFDSDKFLSSAPLPFLMAVLVVFVFGPGAFSLDWLIARKLVAKK